VSFQGVDEYYFEACCHFRYYSRKENIIEEMKRTEEVEESIIDEYTGMECLIDIRRRVWNMMENPETSHIAKAIGFISVFFVLLSSITFCLSTIKEFNVNILEYLHSEAELANYTASGIEPENPVTESIEIICIIWFTFEFTMRFWGAPNRISFLKSPLNLIDLASIIPYYVSLILENEEFKVLFYETNNVRVFRLFRIFRILRIFKLARHSDGLQSFGQTLQKSYNELGLLIMFLSITVLIFSSLAYFVEKDVDETKFKSIPHTFW
jgi:potassium voltage-gated channel Shab-related subfamily B protein 1